MFIQNLWIIISFLIGYFIPIFWMFHHMSGTFFIDETDPSKDIFRITLNDAKIHKFYKWRFIVLKVEAHAKLEGSAVNLSDREKNN